MRLTMHGSVSVAGLLVSLCWRILTGLTSAFTPLSMLSARHHVSTLARSSIDWHSTCPSATAQSQHLQLNLFGNIFGGGEEETSGSTTVLDLPASTVKIGALRFFLQIYLVGEQNKPVKESWFLKTDDEGRLDMYYRDATGMFSVEFLESGIKVFRSGQKPSLEYRLQESLMLHGVLDELSSIAFEVDDIAVEKRLLQFDSDNVIEEARMSLPARPSS